MHDAVGVQEFQAAGDVQRDAAAPVEPAELCVAAAPYGVRQVAALPNTDQTSCGPCAVSWVPVLMH